MFIFADKKQASDQIKFISLQTTENCCNTFTWSPGNKGTSDLTTTFTTTLKYFKLKVVVYSKN